MSNRGGASEIGQRYVGALVDPLVAGQSYDAPSGERLVAHLSERYGIDAVAAAKISQHNDRVFRVDRSDAKPWVARVYPPSRPLVGVEGDAAILRFLGRRDYPAERLAVDDAVSELDGASVLVTEFVDGAQLPEGNQKLAMMGDVLGRLHVLELDDSVSRPGGAAGDDPHHEGSPNLDVVAAVSFLEAVEGEVAPASRVLLSRLRELAKSVDDGAGLPEALLHGNLLHNPDHAVLGEDGPVVINWKAAGRGPRLADVAYLLWGAEWGDGDGVQVAAEAYGKHVELTDDELDRLEAVMYARPLYLACLDFARALNAGEQPTGSEWWWGLIDPGHISSNAAAARAVLGR